MYDFYGKSILITGAAGGIGRVLCAAFTGWRGTVIALDRNPEALSVVASAARVTAAVDLTDRSATARTIGDLMRVHGPIDVLINNAGGGLALTLAQLKPETWDADIALNLTAAYNCVQAVEEPMKARRDGVIINVTSVNALMALGHPAYSAAKAGLVSYTKSLALEYGPYGIRANAIAPGTVKTAAWNDRLAQKPDILEHLLKWYPLRRIPEPQDIANAAGFLASSLSRTISGVVLPVDAGLSAGNAVMAAELTLGLF